MSAVQPIDNSIDILRALLWQDSSRKVIKSLLTSKQAWFDAYFKRFWDDFYTDIFNLGEGTINEFGCAVWGLILDVNFTFSTLSSTSSWGFGAVHKNFTRGNFGTGSAIVIKPSLAEQRFILRVRYLTLTTNCNVFDANRRLATISAALGAGYKVYMLPNPGGAAMTVRYVLNFNPSPVLLYVLKTYPVMPTPAGVAQQFYYNNTPL